MKRETLAQMSTKKLTVLLEGGVNEEDRKTIMDILESRAEMSSVVGTFRVIKKIGEFGEYIVRKFDDEIDARQFLHLCQVSEEKEFIKYYLAKII